MFYVENKSKQIRQCNLNPLLSLLYYGKPRGFNKHTFKTVFNFLLCHSLLRRACGMDERLVIVRLVQYLPYKNCHRN